jgi:small-conductance mechanosensitive channel
MKEKKTGELTAASIANVVGVILFNTVPLWRPYTRGVVLQDFVRVLWAANLSFLVQLAGNLSMILYRPPRFAAMAQIVGTAAGLLSVIVFYVVFPLDFGAIGAGWLNPALRIVLIAGMGGAALGVIVQTIQLASGWRGLAYTSK